MTLQRRIKINQVSPFLWDGSHLGILNNDNILNEESIKIGRVFRVWEIKIGQHTAKCLVKGVESALPAIFDELKPIFSLPKIGTHLFSKGNKMMIAYRAIIINNQVYPETTLDMIMDREITELQHEVRRTLAFRELFGITDTFERSLVIRYYKPWSNKELPEVVSFCEAKCIADTGDNLATVLSQILLQRWFPGHDIETSLEYNINNLLCLNRDCPEASLGYYRPLIEETINRVDNTLIGYLDLFFDRITSFLPY